MTKYPVPIIGTPTGSKYGRIKQALLLTIMLALFGCASKDTTSYITLYKSAVNNAPIQPSKVIKTEQEIEHLFKNMQAVFANLKDPYLKNHLYAAYAEDLYFNDTFHTFTQRDDMITYLLDTANRVTETSAVFEEIAYSNESYFVRWTMKIKFVAAGKTVETDSIGVSQIKFNDQGKIIFHQDFWDNTEGFFRHLPVVGYVLNKTLDRL